MNRKNMKIYDRIIVVSWLIVFSLVVMVVSLYLENDRLKNDNQLLVQDIKQHHYDTTELKSNYETLKVDFSAVLDENSENRELLSQLTAEVSNLKELYTRTDFVTMDEYELLLLITNAEATSLKIESKIHVVDVIQNRVESNKFPNDIYSVVFQKNQFQPTFDNRLYNTKMVQSTIDAVQFALRNDDTTNGALFFMNPRWSSEKNVRWFRNNLTYVMSDGHHEFYK